MVKIYLTQPMLAAQELLSSRFEADVNPRNEYDGILSTTADRLDKEGFRTLPKAQSDLELCSRT